MKEYYFILNPVAGAGKAGDCFARARAELDRAGAVYRVSETRYASHATELARQAAEEGCPCVVSVGGDGTAREVAIGLLHTDVVMGILPFGTGNDFSQAIHIPSDPVRAVQTLLAGRVKEVDTATANGIPYLNFSGFGFDVDVVIHTEHFKKKLRGMLPYMLGVMKALLTLKLRPITVTWPEGHLETRAMLITASNGTHLGGGMHSVPLADVSDGLLDVCIIHDLNRLTVLPQLPRYIKGKHVGNTKYFTYFKTPRLTVETQAASRLDLDGELLGDTPVTYEAVPRSLHMVVGEG